MARSFSDDVPLSDMSEALLGNESRSEYDRPRSPVRQTTSSSSPHDGIQKLLAAEQEAQRIVTAAREAKTQRLRQAKEEATREIKAFKTQLEEQFQQRLNAQTGHSGANFERLAAETATKIEEIKHQTAAKGPEVARMLTQMVLKVPPVST
mmetsp:Transcript_31828/g.38501  ORF Transcript_31828/g.38501 Transcript_31828/m.38501 type:complete len:151 (+) Transcript_31828:130-582(+)|eukprot:CAMPEP_0197848974 /NCGR_PEP_ID=MMETSP1438-20131217/10571_1 /TAXON_ID=1461541 /ORGANISM="Pterosperma sp., Strain CCMP1384" /LENGTH=150 /DNA_ID=CAMNT_0043461461 /DNA_START=112 /DNA_END=564 /DNA_ORIENTATION=-